MAFETEVFTHENVPLQFECIVDDVEEKRHLPPPYSPQRSWASYVLLAISVLTNIILCGLMLHRTTQDQAPRPGTVYAGLARNVPLPFQAHSKYGLGSKTDAARSILWESLDTSTGEISLDNAEARALDLPESSPFPWDESRSTYLLNAYHSLHCLHNGTQLDSYPHLVHCLDHLLSNILCEADDTPMYTSPTRNVTTGDGQIRMCRSWDQLDAWARRRTACFAYVNETQGIGGGQIRRFRYCPQGSPFLGPMRKFFGYAENWWEPAPDDVDTMPKYWEGFEEQEIGY